MLTATMLCRLEGSHQDRTTLRTSEESSALDDLASSPISEKVVKDARTLRGPRRVVKSIHVVLDFGPPQNFCKHPPSLEQVNQSLVSLTKDGVSSRQDIPSVTICKAAKPLYLVSFTFHLRSTFSNEDM